MSGITTNTALLIYGYIKANPIATRETIGVNKLAFLIYDEYLAAPLDIKPFLAA